MNEYWVIRTTHGAVAVDVDSNSIVSRFSEHGILAKAYSDWLETVPGEQVNPPDYLMRNGI